MPLIINIEITFTQKAVRENFEREREGFHIKSFVLGESLEDRTRDEDLRAGPR